MENSLIIICMYKFKKGLFDCVGLWMNLCMIIIILTFLHNLTFHVKSPTDSVLGNWRPYTEKPLTHLQDRP
ncbi:hypothetical protein L6452_37071 [Arctium lappa]|uniref:Uncharacterized protein n=1 Tax=Arctium lappa TaxID=4217 RepID=A0ACB8Y1C6_ARCLA|nr:hypothetical protein L6452_37071 [Arctium lappa]